MQLNNKTRQQKARIYFRLHNKIVIDISIFLSVICLAFGVVLIVLHNKIGWLLLFPMIVCFIVFEWYKYDLKLLDPDPNTSDQSLESLLSANILAKLVTNTPDTKSITQAMYNDKGRIFFHNRFFVNDDLINIAQCAIDELWPKAIDLWKQYKTKNGVDGAHISAAMLLYSANSETMLRAINYSRDEVLAGLSWYSYLTNTIDGISAKQSSGGIARDWSAGYTPLLNRYAQNISYSIQYGGSSNRDTFSHQAVVNQMTSVFTTGGRANIAIVGDVGVGKHMCVNGLADRLIFDPAIPGKIRYSQIYQIDIASLLSAIDPNSLEATMNQIMVEAYHAKNIILFFNNAGQLFGSDGRVDISNFMLPIIEAGNLRSIYSFTSSDWQYLQRNKPALAVAFNYQAVLPTNEEETLKILENEVIFTENQYGCLFTYAGLKEVYRLADRYGPDVAMPERAISVLNDTGRNSTNSLITPENVQKSIEQTTGVKVGLASSQEKDVLLGLETTMHERVIGQDIAIKELVSALKRSRTGVSNSNKPIGTFLFLGPTGVGKTEVSKTLAEAYFGSEDRLIRLDMNEFINADSINRLLTSGNQTSPSFLDKIKQQPFSVVLLDEIEKAHPEIINVFLQLFDEGTLVDNDNRTYSFRDSIIIVTSNAGSEFIREKIDKSVNIEVLTDELTNKLIHEGQFKPELMNRFDDIIIFGPLSETELQQVVAVMLKHVNQELVNQKITVSLSPGVVARLANKGHDPAMGARPLRRLMQKTIETLVADRILSGQLSAGDNLHIDESDISWG